MATVSTAARDAPTRASGFFAALSARPLRPALGVLLLVVAVRALGTVDSDVSWQLWIARQLNHGAQLYRDIVEPNPPLWFWMAQPIDRLSALTRVRSDHLLIVAVGCCAAFSLAATDRLLVDLPRKQRAMLLAYAALVLVAMPWLQFGQREQIALIGAIPYAALIAARSKGRQVPSGLAIAIGVGAGLGFALKHYFLLVPIFLELWLIVGARRKWRPLRPETIAMAALGSLYAAAFAIWARDFFSAQLPLLLLAYGVTGAERFIDLFQPAVLAALAMFALLVSHPRALRSEPLGFAAAMTVAGVGFGAAYFIQAKGWSYHALAFAGCAAIAFATALTARPLPKLVALAAPALLVLPFSIAAQQARRESPTAAEVRHSIADLHAGQSVGFIATDPAFAWDVSLQRGFRNPLRYNGFWMMRAVTRNEAAAEPDPRLVALGRKVVNDAVSDFECTPPKRIIVARPTAAAAASGDFDILAFFLRDPQFAGLLSHYRPIAGRGVEVFELASPLPRATNCPGWSPA
jgi:hypothetical protein